LRGRLWVFRVHLRSLQSLRWPQNTLLFYADNLSIECWRGTITICGTVAM